MARLFNVTGLSFGLFFPAHFCSTLTRMNNMRHGHEMMNKQKGIHVAVYVSKFKDSYDLLKKAQLIWTNPKFSRLDRCDTWEDAKAGRQYRFKDLIDMQTKEKIFEMEHETRSMRHFQYLKDVHYIPFVNTSTESNSGNSTITKNNTSWL